MQDQDGKEGEFPVLRSSCINVEGKDNVDLGNSQYQNLTGWRMAFSASGNGCITECGTLGGSGGNVNNGSEHDIKWLISFAHLSCAKHYAKHPRCNSSSCAPSNLMRLPHFTDGY